MHQTTDMLFLLLAFFGLGWYARDYMQAWEEKKDEHESKTRRDDPDNPQR